MRRRYNPGNWKKQLCFERIKKKHSEIIEFFQTYQRELKDFLIEDALRAQELVVSNTFLVFDKKNKSRYSTKRDNKLILLGYITVLNDSIRLDASLKAQFRDEGVGYKSLPALKIGRISVDNRYQMKGLGSCMVVWAAQRAVYLNQTSACRFLTVDAKRNSEKRKDTFHFYQKNYFKALNKKEYYSNSVVHKQISGTTLMYLDIYPLVTKLRTGNSLNF